uniref:Transcription repressor n=1 Tax=Lotus japonicus TaxID=34305 RepID=I3S9L8_LOTJA|nr:unknown [Lotus japonicus]
MGNHRFKFSDMIPNAWFYKLKDMSKSRKQNAGSHVMKSKPTSPTTASQRSQPRYSHYFSTEPFHTKHLNIPFNDSPTRSISKRRSRRKTIYKPSNDWTSPHQVQSPNYDVSSIENSSQSDLQECVNSESECDAFSAPDLLNGIASNCSCRVSSSTNDIVIDMKNESFHGNSQKLDEFDTISQTSLAPILTKQVEFDDEVSEATEVRSSNESEIDQSFFIKICKEETSRTQRRRKKNYNSSGIRLRVNSPKLGSRKVQGCVRRSVSSGASKDSRNAGFPDGFAVVKSSFDPQSDFRDSMVEMIVENKIRESKDLEDLLACYLSLNSSEYHELIVKAFEQIWYDMAQLRM